MAELFEDFVDENIRPQDGSNPFATVPSFADKTVGLPPQSFIPGGAQPAQPEGVNVPFLAQTAIPPQPQLPQAQIPPVDQRSSAQVLDDMLKKAPQPMGSTEGFAPITQEQVGGTRPLTQAEAARQEEIRQEIATGVAPQGAKPEASTRVKGITEALGGGAEAEGLARQAEQEDIIKRTGDRASAKANMKALEGIMDKATIKKEMEAMAIEAGGTLETLNPKGQAQFLNRIRMREQKKAVGDKKTQRARATTSAKARYNDDGTPKNKYAVAQDTDNWGVDTPDPTNPEKTNRDSMSPSDKREFDRYQQDASRGQDTASQRARMKTIRGRTDLKTQRSIEAEQARVAGAELARKLKTAEGVDEKTFYSTRASRIKALDSELATAKKNLSGGAERAEKKRIAEAKAIINAEVATGYQPPTAETITDEQILAEIPDASPIELTEIRQALASGITMAQLKERVK